MTSLFKLPDTVDDRLIPGLLELLTSQITNGKSKYLLIHRKSGMESLKLARASLQRLRGGDGESRLPVSLESKGPLPGLNT